MRTAIVMGLVLFLGCAEHSSNDDEVLIQGPGMGCGNQDPTLGPVWQLSIVNIVYGASHVQIWVDLDVGETGLYISNLRLESRPDPVVVVPITLANNNLAPGEAPFIQNSTFTVSKQLWQIDHDCLWDALGPYWPDAPL